MASDPLVSIIMATHNRAHLLEHALNSLLGQTYARREIIVIDDASTDDTPAILARLQEAHPAVRVITLSENQGPGSARNRGIEMAQGAYIAIMDDDDVCVPDRLEKQVALLEAHPEVGLCFGLVQWVGDNRQPLGLFPVLLHQGQFPTEPPDVLRLLLLESNKIPNVTIMIRRELMLRYPYWSGITVEDYALALSLSADGVRILGIPEVLVYQDRADSRDGLMVNKARMFRDNRLVLERICREKGIAPELRRRAFSNEYAREGRYWSGLRGLALELRALALWPGNPLARQTLREQVGRVSRRLTGKAPRGGRSL